MTDPLSFDFIAVALASRAARNGSDRSAGDGGYGERSEFGEPKSNRFGSVFYRIGDHPSGIRLQLPITPFLDSFRVVDYPPTDHQIL